MIHAALWDWMVDGSFPIQYTCAFSGAYFSFCLVLFILCASSRWCETEVSHWTTVRKYDRQCRFRRRRRAEINYTNFGAALRFGDLHFSSRQTCIYPARSINGGEEAARFCETIYVVKAAILFLDSYSILNLTGTVTNVSQSINLIGEMPLRKRKGEISRRYAFSLSVKHSKTILRRLRTAHRLHYFNFMEYAKRFKSLNIIWKFSPCGGAWREQT